MDNEEINLNELIEDIRRIKNTIKQNSYSFKQMANLPMFKLVLFTAGLTSAIIPFLYYIFLQNYGSYNSIPFEIRLFLTVSTLITLVIIAVGKFTIYFQIYHITPRLSLFKSLYRFFSRQAMLLYPGLIGTMLFFVIFFIMKQSYHLITPAIAIGIGVCFSMVGSFISFPEFFFLGNYFWFLGTISVPFIINSPRDSLLWASAIFGLGMLFFSFYLAFFYRPDKES